MLNENSLFISCLKFKKKTHKNPLIEDKFKSFEFERKLRRINSSFKRGFRCYFDKAIGYYLIPKVRKTLKSKPTENIEKDNLNKKDKEYTLTRDIYLLQAEGFHIIDEELDLSTNLG